MTFLLNLIAFFTVLGMTIFLVFTLALTLKVRALFDKRNKRKCINRYIRKR